ncbi:MAG TPA: hypothetical protein VHF26_12565 [Trebonia sp.]|nr:hypothetical protein [Trebonia sp.]
MATTLATARDAWAVLPVSANPAFWQVLSRTGNSPAWKLVTPPGVAINGGLVAAAGAAGSLTVAVRPSQNLRFSPLAATANGGASWSTGGPIQAAVAPSPDAFAASGSRLVALLADGTVETSSNAGTTWSAIAKPGAIAASAAARGCGGAVRVTSVSFGISGSAVLAGGTCGTGGTGAVFSYSSSPGSSSAGWQRVSLPVSGQLVRLSGGMALVRGKSGLSAVWPASGASGWTASGPLPLPASPQGGISASGTLAGGGAWVLLPGGRAATVSVTGTSGAPARGTPQWLLLPPVPAHTTVLASGPGGDTDALAVTGDTLAVWRLAPGATVWSEVQTISVPVQVGSSS